MTILLYGDTRVVPATLGPLQQFLRYSVSGGVQFCMITFTLLVLATSFTLQGHTAVVLATLFSPQRLTTVVLATLFALSGHTTVVLGTSFAF